MSELEPHYRMVLPGDLPPVSRAPIHVVLDNLRSAYNVGSIFRTADAGAVAHMHLCGMSVHPPNKKLAKTALGAFDYVPWTYYTRTLDAIGHLQAQRIACVAVEVAENAVPHTRFDWPKPAAIVFGNEVTGIGSEVMERCDATVCIPMKGHKNTINVATAFGVVLYEILRRWNLV